MKAIDKKFNEEQKKFKETNQLPQHLQILLAKKNSENCWIDITPKGYEPAK